MVLNSTAPSGIPDNITSPKSTSTECIIQWVPAENTGTDPDGWILGYKVYYNALNSSNVQTFTVTDANTTEVALSGLEEFENYVFHVVAFNVYGEGNVSQLGTCRTKEAGRNYRIKINRFIS